jgi:hypothetical protein
LQCLRTTNLATVNGDSGIIGHILWLKWRRVMAAVDQRAADPGN